MRLNLNLGTDGLCPFFEMDGSVDDNSYRSLTKLNPYLLNPVFGTKSSVDYNGRFGIGAVSGAGSSTTGPMPGSRFVTTTFTGIVPMSCRGAIFLPPG